MISCAARKLYNNILSGW